MRSAMEAAFILSNLSRHSTYIKSTATHLLSHVRSNEDMIGSYLQPNERERLTSNLSEAVAAVSSLRDEVLTLQREVNLVRQNDIVQYIIALCLSLPLPRFYVYMYIACLGIATVQRHCSMYMWALWCLLHAPTDPSSLT